MSTSASAVTAAVIFRAPGASRCSRINRNVSTHSTAQPTANAARTTASPSSTPSRAMSEIRLARETSHHSSPRISTAHTVTVTRSATRPSRRLPATSWAPPGTSRVRAVRISARRVRSVGEATRGSRSGSGCA